MRTRRQRRYARYVKKMRRLREDQAQHRAYGAPGSPYEPAWRVCPCFTDKIVQAMFANTPRRCRCITCRNPRRVYGNRRGALTVQELRVLDRT